MAQSELTGVVEPVCKRLCEQMNYEFVDAEIVKEGAGRYLRIYISKPDGITLDDCEAYHRAVQPRLESVDYDFLEVCSPGLDRPLKTQRDYDAHVGDLVEVHLYRAVDRCRRFEGELLGLDGDQVCIRIGEDERRFALKEISLCKPVIVVTEEDLAEGAALGGDEEGEASDVRQE